MPIEVFSRFEKKYVVTREQMEFLREQISEYMYADKHNKDGKMYNIANIYYDTKEDLLIGRSIEKPKYKEKLRLRSYGVPELDDKVFLEIKKKYKGLVNKRRTTLKLRDAYKFVDEGIRPGETEYTNKQVMNELEYFLKLYDLEPKVYITYDRYAYFSKTDNDFRLTFDTNIKTRRTDLRLEAGGYGDLLMGEDFWLMEVKSLYSFPLWFVKLLSDNQIYSKSFSKYGNEYRAYIKNQEELLNV
ncbi:MAG: polyphosphate polymerase domain-containing protein [Lachnospiraceae bacterium]|nr:polyphosphate polymerase domain-containing protein [Lachnospiraceae bacterium]